jgi:hypothetical protein
MRTYSDFFKTLHDETGPTGYLGEGTHYSVLRAVVFHDPMGRPLSVGRFADFAVIWDEDHDARVIEPIEQIYRQGLLSSFLMFGENKGVFTAILSDLSPATSDLTKDSLFDPLFLKKIDDFELSIRTANCLKNDSIICIGDLVNKTEGEMLRTPNFGRRPLDEIKGLLAPMGLHLGMEVPGWPPENIDELSSDIARVAVLETKISAICQSLSDQWPSKVVTLEGPSPIISDVDVNVRLYLNNLKMLWRLGIQRVKFKRKVAPVTDIARARLPVA